jgi:hypothetical protein
MGMNGHSQRITETCQICSTTGGADARIGFLLLVLLVLVGCRGAPEGPSAETGETAAAEQTSAVAIGPLVDPKTACVLQPRERPRDPRVPESAGLHRVSGRVLDEHGAPVPFAAVSVSIRPKAVASSYPLNSDPKGCFLVEVWGSPPVTVYATVHDDRVGSNVPRSSQAVVLPDVEWVTGIELIVPTSARGRIGARMGPHGRGLRILGLREGGPAERAGILLGETILAADLAPFAELKQSVMMERVTGAPGTPISLLVESRGGGVRSVEVQRETRLSGATRELHVLHSRSCQSNGACGDGELVEGRANQRAVVRVEVELASGERVTHNVWVDTHGFFTAEVDEARVLAVWSEVRDGGTLKRSPIIRGPRSSWSTPPLDLRVGGK